MKVQGEIVSIMRSLDRGATATVQVVFGEHDDPMLWLGQVTLSKNRPRRLRRKSRG